MSHNNKITFTDELPSIDELEDWSKNKREPVIENYQPSDKSNKYISPYPKYENVYKKASKPEISKMEPLFKPKVDVSEEMNEKDKLYEKAVQKLPLRMDGGLIALPGDKYTQQMLSLQPRTQHPQDQNRQHQQQNTHAHKHPQIENSYYNKDNMSTSNNSNNYKFPDNSYIIYEEETNKNSPKRPLYNNKFPSYRPKTRYEDDVPYRPKTRYEYEDDDYEYERPVRRQRYQHPIVNTPHLQQTMPMLPYPQSNYIQYDASYYPHETQIYQQQPPHISQQPLPISQVSQQPHISQVSQQSKPEHICSLISTHLNECPLCARLYMLRKQFNYKPEGSDNTKSNNINIAIYMIVIIFLIIICIFLFKKLMKNNALFNSDKSE